MSNAANPNDAQAVGGGAFAPLMPHMFEPVLSAHFATASLNFADVGEKQAPGGPTAHYENNQAYWKAAIDEEIFVSQEVLLDDFLILEWYPRCPGLYHLPQAEDQRQIAWGFVAEGGPFSDRPDGTKRTIFEPYGKACMLNGGIGAIRLKPIQMGGDRVHMMTATSNGVCHEGIPLGLSDSLYGQVIQKVRANGSLRVKLRGEIDYVPDDMSALYRRYANLPQIFVHVRDIELIMKERTSALICPTITFSSKYEGEFRTYGCYVNANPGKHDSIDEGVRWMADDYVLGRYKGEVITDFDQTKAHFDNVKFSLEKVMNFEAPIEQLEALSPHNIYFVEQLTADYVHLENNMGDVFSNISNSTIINRSTVEGAFNRARDIAGEDSAKALVEVARIVQEAGNIDAEELLAEFMRKLEAPQPSKPILKSIWDGIVTAVPVLKGMADITTAVTKLFA